MRVRAIKDLCQLTDGDFFSEVAAGLSYILKNVQRLEADSQFLAERKRPRGFKILRAIAEEEAAKFLILIDAVRCPRKPEERFVRQLNKFNNHLAKGIYSQSCYWRPSSLDKLKEIINSERCDLYLDGPNGVDWIFRNDIEHRRQAMLYVDYIETEDGHSWLYPPESEEDTPIILQGLTPQPVQLAEALYNLGVATTEALSVVANTWRQVIINDQLSWKDLRQLNQQTLIELQSKGFLCKQPAETSVMVIDRWQFPLYDVDLDVIHVDKSALRERQESYWLDY